MIDAQKIADAISTRKRARVTIRVYDGTEDGELIFDADAVPWAMGITQQRVEGVAPTHLTLGFDPAHIR